MFKLIWANCPCLYRDTPDSENTKFKSKTFNGAVSDVLKIDYFSSKILVIVFDFISAILLSPQVQYKNAVFRWFSKYNGYSNSLKLLHISTHSANHVSSFAFTLQFLNVATSVLSLLNRISEGGAAKRLISPCLSQEAKKCAAKLAKSIKLSFKYSWGSKVWVIIFQQKPSDKYKVDYLKNLWESPSHKEQ